MKIRWPNSTEAEKYILGTILLDNALLKKCSLVEGDFYSPLHRKIFSSYLDLQKRGSPVDLVTVGETLSREELDRLNECADAAFSATDFPHHEGRIKEASAKRKILKHFLESTKDIEILSLDEMVAGMRKVFCEVLSGRGIDLVPISQLAHDVYSYLEKRAENPSALSGIPSGLTDVDRITDGFQGGDFIILAGRPGTGKSALAMHIGQEVARRGFPVGFISLEMGGFQLGIRSMASASGLPLWKLRKGILKYDHWNQLTRGADALSSLPMWLSFSSRDAGSIGRAITLMVEERDCKIVLLDYLQLATFKDAKNREREVAEVSWTLKTAARTLNIPVVALAQLNRDSERQSRRPKLSDLRDSGAIEQDADVVMFLYREGEGDDAGPVEIIFAKGRNIGTGSTKVYFDRERMTFHSRKEGTE